MFSDATVIDAAANDDLLNAARQALRLVPPAFPLDATVAVNPFLGHVDDDPPRAAARLARAAGCSISLSRSLVREGLAKGDILDEDLRAALSAAPWDGKPASLEALKAQLRVDPSPPRALPTLAELAAEATGTDWPALAARTIGQWAAGHFDLGNALWTPAPGQTAYAAWREWATHDLTPEIAGLRGFCRHVAEAPDSAERALLRAAGRLGLSGAAAGSAFHRLLLDLGGWAQHASWLMWTAEQRGEDERTLFDLLAIRLVWEEALADHSPDISAAWQATVHAHERPLAPEPHHLVDAICQDAAERAFQRRFSAGLSPRSQMASRPHLQAAFCIDVRSEPFRRALENLDDAIETIGFAGFFGLPVSHCDHASDEAISHLPVLLQPQLLARSHLAPKPERMARIRARATRAWGRFRQAAVSSFAFVESTGLAYGPKLLSASLGTAKRSVADIRPAFSSPLPVREKAALAARILGAMGLTGRLAPLVVLVGHGATTTNNPHDSAYQCGACGGHSGAVSARLAAGLLNDAETRQGLRELSVVIPAETCFVAALHDTVTDEVSFFDTEAVPVAALQRARENFRRAGDMTRAHRAERLSDGTATPPEQRAHDWAQVRPEWGLAGCAAFVAAPRSLTRGADLGGRSFLHSYDWRRDKGFSTLELILTAPVVVASWISLQYYGSAVAPTLFGSGNKLIHNVVGGFGVVQGNGGPLCVGLPWQAVAAGADLMHQPLRLSVFIEAPRSAILDVLTRHPQVRTLFDAGWLHLLVLEDGAITARYRPSLAWEAIGDPETAT